jgi:hypothetical protein
VKPEGKPESMRNAAGLLVASDGALKTNCRVEAVPKSGQDYPITASNDSTQ